MDELTKLLESDEWPAKGTAGRVLGWYEAGGLALPSGGLWLGDPEFSWAEITGGEGVIELEPGEYRVSAEVMQFGKGNFISRMRVCREGVDNPAVGGSIGNAGTDSGSMGVCDARELLAAFHVRFGNDEDAPVMFLGGYDFDRFGRLEPAGNAGAALIYMQSGFGDGGGPIVELLDAGRRVGIELAFIEDRTM